MDFELPTVHSEFVNGILVHTSGAGPGLVLLHANGGDHRDFDAVVGVLSRSWTVHRVDWPGHGGSPATISPSAIGFAELVPGLLRELTGGPFVVMGNSVGGFAAIYVASEQSELVKGLILIQPGGFTPRSPLSLLACRLIGSRKISTRAMRVLPSVYLRKRTSAVLAIRRRAIESAAKLESVETFRLVWKSFGDRRHDSRTYARNVQVPTLVVWGTRDPILPWMIDGRRATRAFRNAEVVKFRCGHQAFAESPIQFIDCVEAFARKHSLIGGGVHK
jgi:pimeloyl-ACP methyl ester carboxylesterase